MTHLNRKLIAIVGPTASGKTGVGVKLAKKIGGEIISADSRQVYRRLDIGSGKEGASEAELKAKSEKRKAIIQSSKLSAKTNTRWIDDVPQWLIDVAEPGERFTLFDWLEQARIIIDDIFSRGKTPIVVGGTGLYVSALVEGYQLVSPKSKVPAHSSFAASDAGGQSPKYSRQVLDQKLLEELQQIYSGLGTLDSGLDIRNKRRLIRAIERAQAGEEMERLKPDFETLIIGLDINREELYQRIDKRAEDRFKAGMLEETRNLLSCHPELTQQSHPELVEGSGLISGSIQPLDSSLDPKGPLWGGNDKKKYWDDTRGGGDDEKGALDSGLGTMDSQMAKWLVSLGLDYRIMTQYLVEQAIDAPIQGQKFEEMVGKFKFAEHDYARRQLIWWRKKDIKWAKGYEEVEHLAEGFIK